MEKFVTEILAIDPMDGQMRLWAGPLIEAETIEQAREYCDANGLGYCAVVGKFIAEIPWNSSQFANRLLDDSIQN